MRWTHAQYSELRKYARWGFTLQEAADRMKLDVTQVSGAARRRAIAFGEGESRSERTLRGIEYRNAMRGAA